MNKQSADQGFPARWVNSVVALWAVIFALSFILAFSIEPTGDGFTRGLNRISALIIWQGIAIVVAVVAWLLGLRISKDGPHSRWISRIPVITHAVIVLLFIGLVLVLRFASPAFEPGVPPGPVTAPAIDLPAATAAAAEGTPPVEPASEQIQQFNGIFRGGFEASHFYTMEGQGPWWLEASDADWERINASSVEGPGRSGGVQLALTVNAWLEDIGGELEYLGIDRYRIHVESIEGLRVLSEDEFALVLDTISRR